MSSMTSPAKEPIAIVGSACRFAGGVNNPSKLWELLRNPRDVRREIPDDRFNAKGFYSTNPAQHGHSNVMHSYMIEEDVTAFDGDFFGVKPVEAQAMDPQQRMLMEIVYEAMEASGLTLEGLMGSDTSVFVGVMCADYEALQLRDIDSMPTYFATGGARSILSNRISYFFDWHGPSMTIDTACSSSLVAVHQAVQALRSGESRIAVACGSNLILGPENYIMESKLHMLSPDGIGKMWDESANGYARGEGVATLVLKPLSSAIADGDHIECLIRETGVNQDGATAGITMPSATAQQTLIEDTYSKAGLDPKSRADRPQLFEAHGTGTPAGDPVEAEAISRAFFGQDKAADHNPHDRMSVGSIKTILGHTEGTAGIAAVLRASLAIQHREVPPNLHFGNLNPAIAPFYGRLDIPSSTKPWPDTSQAPRRASVNSFGFGGTNAHAILEGYDSALASSWKITEGPLFSPYVFSARSETSLRAYLLKFATYLQNSHPPLDTHNLAYTLRQRRSALSHRAAYTAESLEALREQIISSLALRDSDIGVNTRALGPPSVRSTQKILGIFTGQGAQYARMGAALVEKSPLADRMIRDLEGHLFRLPEGDRPDWSLRAELVASSTSRVQEAAISQPLCTALQIMLVDLLRRSNVELDVVIGHSSGEIAAAYAAGCLTARDAMVVAYYRGLHCGRAASPNDDVSGGAMLAVGTSMEDATELCEDNAFAGRINVAACNSSSSVTISGDEDAITELEAILADENKFHRRLRVDQAYHSPHMQPCIDAYVQSLLRAGIKAQSSSAGCQWYSSVFNGRLIDEHIQPDHAYWAQNMVQPVLFRQALDAALSDHGSLGVVLEVGPHPALKGPSTQTINEVLECNIPYACCLNRNSEAVMAMSDCMGFLWSHLDSSSFDLDAYETSMSGSDKARRFTVVKGIPSYQWEHSSKHWHESRRSRRIRLRGPSHPLLGDESPDSSAHHRSWRNILKPSEISWLDGHRVQGQVVFPAAGYITTVLEAAKVLAAGMEIRLIEISDFVIHRAITFDSETSTAEVFIEMSHLVGDSDSCIRTKFTYSAALESQTSDLLSLVSNGEVRIILGAPSPSVLPRRQPQAPHLLELEPSRLYNFMESLGYNFSGPFKSLENLRRKHGQASCQLPMQDSDSPLLFHPAEVDAALQSVLLAYSYPGDDQLRNLHMPASIVRLRVNPFLCSRTSCKVGRENFNVDSFCRREDRAATGSGFAGHFNLYAPRSSHAALQADGIRFVPFAGAISGDRNVFYKTDWVPIIPDGTAAAAAISLRQEDIDFQRVLGRVAAYYLRKFDAEVPADSLARIEPPLCHYLNYARQMTDRLRKGEHKYAQKHWLADTFDDIMENVENSGFSDRADLQLALLVGETMPRVFNQQTTMIEHMRISGLLDEYYSYGFGMKQSSNWLSQIMKQITDRDPHLSILEIGAGTGGATKDILSSIGRSFATYTFTDVSSSFFENAAEALASWTDRMVFKSLDAEKSPTEQGFAEGQYDVVIASFVIHATARLADTLRNLRKLLKPGGYLVVGEGTSDVNLLSGHGFIFGSLPGWWLGVDEGRNLTPFINLDQWDALLKETGFSGLHSVVPPGLSEGFGLALFVSQAVDDRISFLREPLAVAGCEGVAGTKISKLVIIGGATGPVKKLVSELELILTPPQVADEIISCNSLEDVDYTSIDESTYVICLAELDAPSFEDMTQERWNSFKKMFEKGKTLLWVSTGRLSDQPWSNLPVGFGRTALNEIADLHAQFLDFSSVQEDTPRRIAEALLRLQARDFNSDEILWKVESEIAVVQDGKQLVPRLRSLRAANDRYNSVYRPIFREIDISSSVVELKQTADSCVAREISRYEVAEHELLMGTRTIKLRTTFAVLSALKTSVGHQFLMLGIDQEGRQYLCLVPRLSSLLEVPETCALPCELERHQYDESRFLTSVAAHMVALFLLDQVFPSQKIALYSPQSVVAQATAHQASRKGVSVLCYTTESENSQPSSPGSWTILPPYASRFEILESVPVAQLALFAGLSREEDYLQRENEATMISTLSSHCRRETAATIYSLDGYDAGSTSSFQFGEILKRSTEFALETASLNPPHGAADLETINLATLPSNERPKNPLTIIDWTSSSKILAQISRLDVKPLFKRDRTYWVCGMSGDLGISVCDWMIDRGARYLVVTSRNPKMDQAWVETYKRVGVFVNIMSCDVTDEKALRAVHRDIVQSMPLIAGVLHGAMVLRDTSIPNMEYDDVMDVVKPKVLGSLYLDRIFHDDDLDFFILISSIACIVGNVGQANYAAANMYTCALAANRRRRGLNAVALNGGAIVGAGYMTRDRDRRALDLTREKMALMPLSEEDFHQMIAQAIESGHMDSTDGAEITTGLLNIDPDSPYVPIWCRDPKLSHFVVQQSAGNEVRRDQSAVASIQDQLQDCKTRQDLTLLIEKSFINQLRKLLLTPADVSNEEMLSKPSTELGLDSLISVDLRSWFMKNFRVSIPVLKIMGNDSMLQLVQTVVESIPAEMVPDIPFAATEVHSLEKDDSSSSSTSMESGTETNVTTPTAARCPALIDWEAEAAARADLGDVSLTTASPLVTPPEVIIVTGVTGHLGHHLLEHLLGDTSIKEIHCLAVRRLAIRLRNKELLIDSRIRYHEGNLSDHLLGLSRDQADSLFARADVVIHNGADTSHVKFYKDLSTTNVDSTVTLARLCLPRRIPMHYISSAGVCIYYNRERFPAVSVTGPGSLTPAPDGCFGYACSKWVNERLLERVHERYGLRVCIYRPSIILRQGADAATPQAELDRMNALLQYTRKIGAAPRIEHNRGALDLVRTETCCAGVLGRVRLGLEGLQYVNQVGDVVVPMDNIRDVDADKGRRYGLLPMDEWTRRAVEAGLHPGVAQLIREMDVAGMRSYPRLSRDPE